MFEQLIEHCAFLISGSCVTVLLPPSPPLRPPPFSQVEMFLLGYALQCTIQVYRLYKAGTEEFVTYYPDDHKDDWPPVCLVTEDDRHYNVPVADAAEETREPHGAS